MNWNEEGQDDYDFKKSNRHRKKSKRVTKRTLHEDYRPKKKRSSHRKRTNDPIE